MASLKQFALNVLASFFKGSKDNKELPTYPDKPYSEKQKEKQKEESIKKDKYREFENSLVYYGTLKQQYTDKMRRKESARKDE